jgi:hypothetical protein
MSALRLSGPIKLTREQIEALPSAIERFERCARSLAESGQDDRTIIVAIAYLVGFLSFGLHGRDEKRMIAALDQFRDQALIFGLNHLVADGSAVQERPN